MKLIFNLKLRRKISYVCLILNIQYHNVFVVILLNDQCSFLSCCKHLNNHVSKSIFFTVEIPTEMISKVFLMYCKLLMRFQPVFAHPYFHYQRDSGLESTFHLGSDQFGGSLHFLYRRFEQEFVMNLQQHFGF